MTLLETPMNTHQLAQVLELDYKSIQHHMKVLEKNNIVSKFGEKYGAIYHLSNFLEINIRSLDDVIDKLQKNLIKRKLIFEDKKNLDPIF